MAPAEVSVRPAGSPRPRLVERFGDLWARRLAVVVGPAGSGKSTLLAQVAQAVEVPVAWYVAEDMDAHASEFLARLGRALASVSRRRTEPEDWSSPRKALAAIERIGPEPVLLVIDDLHRLEGTDAEAVLERLVDHSPAALAVVVASRLAPPWNLSRRRVTGQLIEITGDDLRFRSWEVEQLFRGHYGTMLDPADIAALTRHTEGWAAALQLFHLVAARKSPVERHRMMTSMGSHLRLVREYLVHNVVDELPAELRTFLLDTCVLGRLRADLCDEVRGQSGSDGLLSELERRQLVSWCDDDGGWYRVHEVLRSHLETTFLRAASDQQSHARFLLAGSLLESAGALSDALLAYCRAEDWDAAGRLLGHKGEELSGGPMGWVEGLPPALLRHDPWLLLADARRQRAAGQWSAATETYHRAERAMPESGPAALCRGERAALLSWVDPSAVRLDGWAGVLRRGMSSTPLEVHSRYARSSDARLVLVAALAALAAGCPALASPTLARVVHLAGCGPVEGAAARLGLAAAALLAGEPPPSVDDAAETLESFGISGLLRIATALRATAAHTDTGDQLASIAAACCADGEPWGESAVALLEGWRLLAEDRPTEAWDRFDAAAARLASIRADVPEALAVALRALAGVRCRRPGAAAEARRAERSARMVGSPGAEVVAATALAERGADVSMDHQRMAGCGLVLPHRDRDRRPVIVPTPDAPPSALRCFGGFAFTLQGERVELNHLKPKARRVLRHLAMHCPGWVHREVLMEAVWPAADPVAGARNLQVVVSTLRHALAGEASRGRCLIARQGAAYSLVLPDGAWIDHVVVDRAAANARAARDAGDLASAEAALRQVLEVASGPLLPEDGPDEWVLNRRSHYRSLVVSAAESLAQILVEQGRPAEGVVACELGLAVDRCSDRLWRLLVRTYDDMGDVAASARARGEYQSVLASLGLG